MNMQILSIIIYFSIFVFLFSILINLTKIDRVKEKNLNRLSVVRPEDVEENTEEEKKDKLYSIYENLYNTKFIQANLRITYKEFKTYFYSVVLFCIALVIVSFLVFPPLFSALFGVFLCVLVYMLPDFIVNNKKTKRRAALSNQKSDILSIMSSCSTTQMPLDKTFKVLSQRLKPPASEVFGEAYRMMALGNTADEVLRHLKKVFDSNDFNFLLSSYEVWQDNQGSLQDTYRIVSIAIRDKEEIDLQMNGFISKVKTSFIIIVLMSVFFVGLSLYTISEIFIPFSKSILGQIAIVASFFILLGGIYFMNKIKNSVKY